jgi:uncharacterized protein YcbK (DUF882 family)
MIRPKFGVYGTVGPAVGFTWDEVRCTDGTLPSDLTFRRRAVQLARHLNVLRKKIATRFRVKFTDVSIIVNSWFRSARYNAKIGGARFSQHVYAPHGIAVDIRIRVRLMTGKRVTLAPRFVALLAAAYVPAFNGGGIGWYDARHGSFTHLDTRRGRARWVNVG